jgi:predicted Zn-dependent peptidase
VYRQCETNLGLASTAGAEALFSAGEAPLARIAQQVAEVSEAGVAGVARRYFGGDELVRVSVGPTA